MAYIPPIKKRKYISAIDNGNKIVSHACVKCGKQYPVKQKGIWFELANHDDAWCWVCKPCLDARGIRCD